MKPPVQDLRKTPGVEDWNWTPQRRTLYIPKPVTSNWCVPTGDFVPIRNVNDDVSDVSSNPRVVNLSQSAFDVVNPNKSRGTNSRVRKFGSSKSKFRLKQRKKEMRRRSRSREALEREQPPSLPTANSFLNFKMSKHLVDIILGTRSDMSHLLASGRNPDTFPIIWDSGASCCRMHEIVDNQRQIKIVS
eukprot:scaffold4415_cov127-Cylindrotheca_fusiformis.AAC.1